MGCIVKLRGEMVCGLPFLSVTSCSDQLQGAGVDRYALNFANVIFVMKFTLSFFLF